MEDTLAGLNGSKIFSLPWFGPTPDSAPQENMPWQQHHRTGDGTPLYGRSEPINHKGRLIRGFISSPTSQWSLYLEHRTNAL